MSQPGSAGAARTDNRHVQVQQQAGVADHEQRGGRLRDMLQLRRKIRIGASKQPMTGRIQPRQIGGQPRLIRSLQPVARRFAK